MRIIVTRLLAASALLSACSASAETLREALLKAYRTNPTLTGARAGQRATDEGLPIARSAGLPSLSVNGRYTENALSSGNSLLSPARQAQGNTQLVVPIYRAGAVKNAVRAAETRVEAGRASLRGTEAAHLEGGITANQFTTVVGAFEDVIRDEAIVSLNQQNVHVLEVNLRASRDRFQVGDLTRTDVAQSEARLSIARSQLQTAEAQLISSR